MKIAVGCLRRVAAVAASTTFNSCDVTLSVASGACDSAALTERRDTPHEPLIVWVHPVIGFRARLATGSLPLLIGRGVWLQSKRADFGWRLAWYTFSQNDRRQDMGVCRQGGSTQVPAIRTRWQHVQVGRRMCLLTPRDGFTGRPYELVALIPSPVAATRSPELKTCSMNVSPMLHDV